MRKFLVVLLALGLLAVGGDRIAHRLATDEAESRLSEHGLSEPSVDVRGFPFVMQLISRKFDDVRVSASILRTDHGNARLVSGMARDVRVPRRGPVVVGHLDARGTVPYSEVLQRVSQQGLDLGRAGPDTVRLRRKVTVLGQAVVATARGRVDVRGDRLRVVPTSIALADGHALDDRLSQQIAASLSFSYPVRGLPSGMKLRGVVPADNGFLVTASGDDLRVNR